MNSAFSSVSLLRTSLSGRIPSENRRSESSPLEATAQRTRRWHLDEMVVPIARKRMYLSRAVDHEGEILDISAHYDSLIAVPATISKVNQSASAGGLGEGGNDDESQKVSEEDPGGGTRYGNHAGPGG